MLESTALLFTFAVNLPFGYWRGGTRKLSKEWFLAVHMPVPLVFVFRTLSSAPIYHIPVFVAAFFAGQFIGNRLRRVVGYTASKCLVMDVIRLILRTFRGTFK